MNSAEQYTRNGRKLVVTYGGGVNTIAALIRIRRLGMIPDAIVMADPGSERRGTVAYRDEVMPPWLRSAGFPQVTVITRIEEGARVKRAWRLETLEAECARLASLPSVAYGWKKCSAKYKGDTQRWWAARQEFATDEWAQGRRIIKAIGYDAGESHRVIAEFQNEWERAGLDRDDCENLIRDEGLPIPPKSSCTFCPNNSLEEWEQLRAEEPDAFARAVEMSRRAESTIESPDVVGLMRCSPHGKRQLHVWADGGYDGAIGGREDPQPCECAL